MVEVKSDGPLGVVVVAVDADSGDVLQVAGVVVTSMGTHFWVCCPRVSSRSRTVGKRVGPKRRHWKKGQVECGRAGD